MPEPRSERRVVQITLIRAKPDRVDTVAAQLAALAEPSGAEPGCLSFDVLQGDADPQDFAVVEAWISDAALDAHLASSPVARLLHPLVSELESGLEMRRYRVKA